MKSLVPMTFLLLMFLSFRTIESKMTMEQIKNTMKPFKNSCFKKITIDEALVEGTKRGEFPEEQSLKCFLRCILTMMKAMKNGELSLSSIMAQIDVMFPDELVDKMKEICTNCEQQASGKEDSCDIAFEFVSCFYSADPELYFFP